MKDILKILRHRIKRDCGKKCESFNINCMVCQVYLALDILEEFYFDTLIDVQWEKRKHER